MGSITHVIDSENKEILNHYEYDVWGNLTTCEEKVQNRFRFNGQQYEPISQQYYLRARYYNPVIGRFTQEDTYNVDGLNLYAYCRNNPVSYVDPSEHLGLKSILIFYNPVSYVDPSGNICGRRANTLMDNVLNGNPLTRKERRQLSARLRDEARNGTISDKGRNVAWQMGIDIEDKYSSFGDMSFEEGKKYSAWNKLREEGLTFEQSEKIKYIEKGQKPAPETYLSNEYIENHLQSFKNSEQLK